MGGNAPRQTDQLTIVGPYKLVRHPMYSAVLCISLGLACLLQSWAFLAVFVIFALLYEFLIRRIAALRLVFGLEPAPARRREATP